MWINIDKIPVNVWSHSFYDTIKIVLVGKNVNEIYPMSLISWYQSNSLIKKFFVYVNQMLQ